MSIAVICTGTELLKGSTVNSNLAYLGRSLTSKGIKISLALEAGDKEYEIHYAISSALKQATTLVISGGLGPTIDDITLASVARFFGLELYKDAFLVKKVETCWKQFHKSFCPKIQYKQALVPKDAKVIPNQYGSASGIEITTSYNNETRHIFLIPGPPREFEPMMDSYVVDRLVELEGDNTIYTLGFLAFGMGESYLAKIVEGLVDQEVLEIAYTTSCEGTKLFLSGKDKDLIVSTLENIRKAIGFQALPIGETLLAPYVVKQLIDKNISFCTAESCTGGLIGAEATTIPGVSSVYKGGVIVYSNELKNKLLSVPNDILATYGAVSSQTALLMAEGATKNLECQLSVAVTGIAGPGGGSVEKPVGLVYVAGSFKGKTVVKELHLKGDRENVRARTRAIAWQLILEMLKDA
jgi:nicotinamide-nucleotide amidase